MTVKVKGSNNENESKTNKLMVEYSKSMEPLLKDIAENINELKCSFEKVDLAGIERHAHVIKKISSKISASAVKSAVFKVELAIRRGNIAEAAEYFKLVTKEFYIYKKQLKNYENS